MSEHDRRGPRHCHRPHGSADESWDQDRSAARVAALCDEVGPRVGPTGRRRRCCDVRRRLDEPLRVAIAGRLKAGKSTLVNALIGRRVAPTEVGECTRIVTQFRYGTADRVDVVRRDGTRRQPAAGRGRHDPAAARRAAARDRVRRRHPHQRPPARPDRGRHARPGHRPTPRSAPARGGRSRVNDGPDRRRHRRRLGRGDLRRRGDHLRVHPVGARRRRAGAGGVPVDVGPAVQQPDQLARPVQQGRQAGRRRSPTRGRSPGRWPATRPRCCAGWSPTWCRSSGCSPRPPRPAGSPPPTARRCARSPQLPQAERPVLLASVDLFRSRRVRGAARAARAAAAPARPVRHRLRDRAARRPARSWPPASWSGCCSRRPGSRGCGRPWTRRSGGAPTRSRPAGRCPAWRRSPATPSARSDRELLRDAIERVLQQPDYHRLRLLEVAQLVTTGAVELPEDDGAGADPAGRCPTDPQWILGLPTAGTDAAGHGGAGGGDPVAGVRGGRRQPRPVAGGAGRPPRLLPAVPAGARQDGA